MNEPHKPASGPLSFERDIRPLFRDKDQTSMLRAFDQWSHGFGGTASEPNWKTYSAGTSRSIMTWLLLADGLVERANELCDGCGHDPS
jgi:hypothetical protein